jgi:hypothetical protein
MASKDLPPNHPIQDIQYDELCHRHGYCVMKIKPSKKIASKEESLPASPIPLISRNAKESSGMVGFSTGEIRMTL